MAKFWKSMKNHPALTSRPQLQSRPDLQKVVPLALHGDSVQYMQIKRAGGKSLEVLSWCSLLTKGPTKMTSFLIFLVVKSVVKDDGFNLTWPRVWRVLSWSLEALSTGLWPLKDWNGQDFQGEPVLTLSTKANHWLLALLPSSLFSEQTSSFSRITSNSTAPLRILPVLCARQTGRLSPILGQTPGAVQLGGAPYGRQKTGPMLTQQGMLFSRCLALASTLCSLT